jgi:predicted Zn finger-like uncharacterized protein
MQIVCPSCNASYNIPDGKIPDGKKVTATCKKCGNRFAVSSPAKTHASHPVPVVEQVTTPTTPPAPASSSSGTDSLVFTEYPALQSLPSANFDLKEILSQNKNGTYKSRKNTLKVKTLNAVAGVLPQMLHDGERVVRVAKGTANYPIEIFLGNGFLTMMYNHYAVICTSMRILFINIDHRIKKPTHYLFQMAYHELKKVDRGTLFGSLTFKRKKGKRRVFSGMKRAFSKEIKTYVTKQILDPPSVNPEQAIENLCPACFTALGKGLTACSACNTGFKEPKKALLRSLILPGLGDIYLGHRVLGALELIGSIFIWIIIIASLLAGEEGSIGFAVFLLILYNGLDGLLTFHMAKKGYMLAV